jgi:hypothetical protein
MVSVLASSTVDRGFETRSSQTKDYKIGICWFSAKHAALMKMAKTGWLMCPSGAKYLSALIGHLRANEWLLFNTNSAIFQLYYGDNVFFFNEMMMMSALF